MGSSLSKRRSRRSSGPTGTNASTTTTTNTNTANTTTNTNTNTNITNNYSTVQRRLTIPHRRSLPISTIEEMRQQAGDDQLQTTPEESIMRARIHLNRIQQLITEQDGGSNDQNVLQQALEGEDTNEDFGSIIMQRLIINHINENGDDENSPTHLLRLLLYLRLMGAEQQKMTEADLDNYSYKFTIKNVEKELPNEELKKCTMCMENFKIEENARRLPCLHIYHQNCIDKWLKNKPECPLCKRDIRNLEIEE